jgi:hypothetical protein
MARIILIATRLLVSMSTASTTLPNVPWPSKRTVRSRQPIRLCGRTTNGWKKPTALIDYVIWGDNVMTLFIVARDRLFWCLFECVRSNVSSIWKIAFYQPWWRWRHYHSSMPDVWPCWMTFVREGIPSSLSMEPHQVHASSFWVREWEGRRTKNQRTLLELPWRRELLSLLAQNRLGVDMKQSSHLCGRKLQEKPWVAEECLR